MAGYGHRYPFRDAGADHVSNGCAPQVVKHPSADPRFLACPNPSNRENHGSCLCRFRPGKQIRKGFPPARSENAPQESVDSFAGMSGPFPPESLARNRRNTQKGLNRAAFRVTFTY